MTARLPAAILFDWDNTLIDTFPLLFAAHNEVRAALGVPLWSQDEARQNIRLAAKDAFPMWYGARAQEASDVYDALIRANHLRQLEILDGVPELLDWLARQNMPMGIVSNKRGEFLRAEVSHCGWADRFGAVIGADDIRGPGKPSPEGVGAALKKLNISAVLRANSWYVGDTENDIRTAKAAGMIPVFIENRPMADSAEIKALGPEYAFSGARECLAYLQSLS